MTRDEAYSFLTSQIKNPNLIKHHLAAEAVMKDLAIFFKNKGAAEVIEENKWAITGLLHDADYEKTRDDIKKHTFVLEEILKDKIEPEILHAIKCHNPSTKTECKNLMDWSMYCCDELTGLIIAAALVHPDRKLFSLSPDFILNRFNEKTFAKGANRDQINMCEEKLGIPLKEFIEISLLAMQKISSQLGL